ncbi:hypothetical protein AAur_0937 [Paenarthrobacter aurescens TC1]|uniref:Uncharacterized protein n=1 Tax=Paenarthrobacter aurescens (strain TC1) TaxID=290340 RepID=A1R3B5_PAEAT|nr:hypothetical protein AAur_0937 [Paenarthrobacter aurescens TC1]
MVFHLVRPGSKRICGENSDWGSRRHWSDHRGADDHQPCLPDQVHVRSAAIHLRQGRTQGCGPTEPRNAGGSWRRRHSDRCRHNRAGTNPCLGGYLAAGQHSAAYYRDQIPFHRTVMAVSVAVPALAALVSGYSVLARPRNTFGGITGAVVVVICLTAAVLCWRLGTEAVRRSTHWAEHTTGQWQTAGNPCGHSSPIASCPPLDPEADSEGARTAPGHPPDCDRRAIRRKSRKPSKNRSSGLISHEGRANIGMGFEIAGFLSRPHLSPSSDRRPMLQFPSTHKPRYNDFSIKASSHETIRDAGERAPFSAQQ